jgi:hypothetical protein
MGSNISKALEYAKELVLIIKNLYNIQEEKT